MECRLILKPNKYNKLEVILDETPRSRLFNRNKIAGIVYSDIEYSASIFFEEKIKSLKIFINNKLQEYTYDSGNITFENNGCTEKRVFTNYFGCVNFTIDIETNSGSHEFFYSDYYDVGIRDNKLNENVRKMAEYVFDNSPKYLFNNSSNVMDFLNIKNSRFKNIDTEISILENILREYEENFKFFITNSKYKTFNNYIVDDFEKLKEIKCETIQYIASNPQYLIPVSYFTHIKYNKLNLQPRKVLVDRTRLDYDIYENQVVVSFLSYIYKYLYNKIIKIKEKVIYNPSYSIRPSYISSYKEIYKHLLSRIENYINRVEKINKGIQRMYFMYSKILKCSHINITRVPKPSHIFMEIQHYRRIYKVIADWFESGNYDFENEKMLLSLIEVNKIYEYYILFKINNYLIKRGFFLKKSIKAEYKLKDNQLYENTEYENTFMFTEKFSNVTVYYQPVIYDGPSKYSNGVGLFRNNCISFDSSKSNYYAPDYVIKICKGKSSKFIILDAKWSNFDTVLHYRFKEIVYKYIFSISTIDENDEIDKVCVVNGKPKENQIEYIYNYYSSKFTERNNQIKPSAKILTLHPDIDKNTQEQLLDNLFSEIVFS
ncbi:hypothetical protein [Clostridium sp. JN-1]|uniref:hypothetical protein n=1 Tax=Clostridium sp. JN-1 TaxID=2483110 RepID=UPI000F0BCADD|nr:hypothetical protein [Clostridium sp. JN-1]